MTLAVQPRPYASQAEATKKVGFVVRVSTDRQAANDEGSLKTQLQRLRRHVEYKREACGETWVEARVYELRAVSGKDSVRSPEFQRLYADIRAGRVNVIAATAMDRVTRSVKDFLALFEFLQEHGVEFVSLKEQCDTSAPVGRLFATMIMALAQFERENTAERTRDATAARAERGLWNGGRILGYDPDPKNRSSLIPNPDEATIVDCAFDTYLARGSIAETVKALNGSGYRTKAYFSRRGKHHPGKPFTITSVQYLLKNPAYIGRKEIGKRRKASGDGDGYRLVDAVWAPIVDDEKFEQVQRLMAANGRTNHNGSRPVRHTYTLNGALLYCGRCHSAMEGRSGTGRLGTTYFYYVCRNADCRLRVAAEEIEEAVVQRIGQLASEDGLLECLAEETNQKMARQKPSLASRRRSLQKGLDEVKAEADKLMGDWSGLEEEGGRAFLMDKLGAMAQRRTDLEHGIAEMEEALKLLDREQVTAEAIRAALAQFSEAYTCLTPFERKELMRLVLRRAEVSERQIVLELYPVQVPQVEMAQSHSRSEPPNWLPGQDSNLQPSG